MQPENVVNHHVSYPDVYRYWSVGCEAYAGGDALLTKMRQGWEIDGAIYSEDHWHAGMRLVVVFHIELVRGDEKMHMPVVSNPFVRRLIRQEALQVRSIEERAVRRQRMVDSDATTALN